MAEESLGLNIWSERDLGVDTFAANAFDSVSDADIKYYTNLSYPFIQLVNADTVFGNEMPLNFVEASNGWQIHDYSEAISASAPHSSSLKKNAASVLDQAKTAEEIVKLINTKGWVSVEIIAGTESMKRFVWMEGKKAKLDLIGYTPTASDEKCYERLAKRAKDMGLVWEYSVARVDLKEGATTAK